MKASRKSDEPSLAPESNPSHKNGWKNVSSREWSTLSFCKISSNDCLPLLTSSSKSEVDSKSLVDILWYERRICYTDSFVYERSNNLTFSLWNVVTKITMTSNILANKKHKFYLDLLLIVDYNHHVCWSCWTGSWKDHETNTKDGLSQNIQEWTK